MLKTTSNKMKGTSLLLVTTMRQFSTKKPPTPQSEFKSFFRLRLQDRPIRLASKLKETYKTNKTIQRTLYMLKYFFAFSCLFFVFPGTFIPGQYQAKLYVMVEGRRKLTQMYANMTNPSGSGADFVKTLQFLSWKFNYLRKNGMLSAKLLAKDLHELCKMIDELSLMGAQEGSTPNTVIYECLSYIHTTFLPTLLKHNIAFFQKDSLQTAIMDFLDIISLRFEPSQDLEHLRINDQEEYLYREALMTQYVNLCLIALKFTPQKKHVTVYSLLEEVMNKCGGNFELAQSFTTMEGIQILLQDLNAEEQDERVKLSGTVSKEVTELRYKALHMIRFMIEKDDLVAVKMFKMKIMSNLLMHTLKEKGQDKRMREEIRGILAAFSRNQYRESLITQSQDFKEEKKRLEHILKNGKDYPQVDQEMTKVLADSLSLMKLNK